MPILARDVMRTDLISVPPDLAVPELEERFLRDRVSGYPVLDGEHLVGIVSRSDVIRRLCVERSAAGVASDFYHFAAGGFEEELESFGSVAERVGARIDELRVRDVMVRLLITVEPGHSIRHVARTLVDNGIHRVLVTEGNRLLGIISSTDVVRLVAEGRDLT